MFLFHHARFVLRYWQIPVIEHCKDMTRFTCKFWDISFQIHAIWITERSSKVSKNDGGGLEENSFSTCLLGRHRFLLKRVIRLHQTSHRHFRTDCECWTPHKTQEYKFACNEVQLLVQIVSKEGISLCFDKIRAIADVPTPHSKTELRSILGLVSNYRPFIKNFEKNAAPLHDAATLRPRYVWTSRVDDAFDELNWRLCQPPTLAYPNFYKPFIVKIDASSFAVGAIRRREWEREGTHNSIR